MRKRKEHIPAPKRAPLDFLDTEAFETEIEQRYDEIDGETSSEGVGRGFDSLENPRRVFSADGPVAGDSIEPPITQREGHASRSNRPRKNIRGTQRGSHIAARSSRAI